MRQRKGTGWGRLWKLTKAQGVKALLSEDLGEVRRKPCRNWGRNLLGGRNYKWPDPGEMAMFVVCDLSGVNWGEVQEGDVPERLWNPWGHNEQFDLYLLWERWEAMGRFGASGVSQLVLKREFYQNCMAALLRADWNEDKWRSGEATALTQGRMVFGTRVVARRWWEWLDSRHVLKVGLTEVVMDQMWAESGFCSKHLKRWRSCCGRGNRHLVSYL